MRKRETERKEEPRKGNFFYLSAETAKKVKDPSST